MTSLLTNRWLQPGLRLVIGAIFVYAGVLKLIAPEQFADNIASFQILPNALVNIAALGLPVSEILAGVMMVVGWRSQSATLFTLILAVIFALALGQALARGLTVDCGCFGSGKPSMLKMWLSLGRDCLLLAGCALVYFGCALKRRSAV
jgi:uncharacterized membrane protein YphA (DoxX/SURF4 family)